MNRDEYLSMVSEANELKGLLAEIPVANVIDRMGLESRLRQAEQCIASINGGELPRKAKLTFRGAPVEKSYGVSAEFASRATSDFAEAYSAIVAGLFDNIKYMGPIPGKSTNQLLITGTAIGSFGFEFELPAPETEIDEQQVMNLGIANKAEDAMEKLERLFEMAANGSDDDIAELVDEIHPRAVKKAVDFLKYVSGQQAFCGLEFKEHFFRFKDVAQVRTTVERLESTNIKEGKDSFHGELQGVLPRGRTFEFNVLEDGAILRGKIGSAIDDPDILNRKHLHKTASITLKTLQVGQGRPRYTLGSLNDIENSET